MAKDEANDEGEEDGGGGGGGGLIPLILGALTVVLNIAILVYLILFPAGGGAMVDEMTLQVKAIHDEVLPTMSEQISAIATEIVPGGDEDEDEDEEGGDEDEEEEEGDEEEYADDEYEEEYVAEDGGDLSEITMMLTDTQLILRQMAENINSDNASIKRSVRGASNAGKQIRNLRQDLIRIEKKLNEILEGGPRKKKRGGGGVSQFPEVDEGLISYP